MKIQKKHTLNKTMMIQVKLFLDNHNSSSSKLILAVTLMYLKNSREINKWKEKMRKIMKTTHKIHNQLVIRDSHNILNNNLHKIPDNNNNSPAKNRNLNNNNNSNQLKNNRKRNKVHLS